MRKLTYILVLSILFPVIVFAQEKPSFYHQALVHFNKGDFQEAVTLYTKYLENNSSPEAMLNLARSYMELGKYDLALNKFTELNKKNKGMANYAMAQLYAIQNEAEKSVYYLELHLKSKFKLPENEIRLDEKFKNIEDSEVWKKLWQNDWYSDREKKIQEIKYLNNSGNYFEALQEADKSLKNYKRSHELYAARAEVYSSLKNPKAAIANYDRAIDINKRQVEYFINRGRAYLQIEKYKKALSDFDRALKLSDDYIELYIDKSLVLNGIEKYGQAIKDIETYLSLIPDDVKALSICGEIYYNNQQYVKAIDKFTKVIEISPGMASGYFSRGEGFYKNKQYKQAYDDFTMSLDLDPYNPLAYLQRGYVRLRLGQYNGACYDWEKATEMGSAEAGKKVGEFCQ